jgi:hypothetical protein
MKTKVGPTNKKEMKNLMMKVRKKTLRNPFLKTLTP